MPSQALACCVPCIRVAPAELLPVLMPWVRTFELNAHAGWNLNPEEQAAFQVAERIAAEEAAQEAAAQRNHVHQD